MAVPMHSTAATAGKVYSEQRAIPGETTKAPSTSTGAQQASNRPSSAAPSGKVVKEADNLSTNAGPEDISSFKEGSSTSTDVLRSAPPPNMTFPLDASAFQPNPNPMRGGTAGTANQPFLSHPYFNSAMNMNVTTPTGYGAPSMQFYPTNYNPNAFPGTQTSNQPRPGPP